MDKHITINGQIRHRYNSEGELIHPTDEGIHNFYNWFGESKATDNQGRPRVFYHGTDAKFDTFLPRKGKTSTIFGVEDVERQGHFFTPSLDFAKEFTKSGNVMKVYLNMHKPFDMRNGVTSEMYDTMDKHGINPKWLISNHIDDWERFDGEDGAHFKDALHKSGHDSAIIFEPHGKEAREAHIVFHPNQIKSVTDNSGNFNMSKESINESTKDEIQNHLNKSGFEIHDYVGGTARKIGSDGSRTLQISKVLGKAKIDNATINAYNMDRQSRGLPHNKIEINKDSLPSHIDVDGVKRPTTNSKGAQIHPSEEGVRNFWKWFGDSNTVDHQGRPVVHYHGTQSSSEIDSFKSGSSAHWVTHDLELASRYAKGKSVYPVYVKSHTPFNTRDISKNNYTKLKDYKRELEVQSPNKDVDSIKNLSKSVEYGEGWTRKSWESPETVGHYKNLGFDSIHHSEDGIPTVGVFHPNQLKSAIGNSGVYSGTKTNINESVEHPMIDVDGEMKHRHNSEGRPIHHTDEGIRNFHKWFDKSKAVDEHGRPQVFYHGTTKNFKSFDPSKAGQKDHGWYGVGHYFTPDVHTASAYSTYDERHTTGANVMPVYLKIHNPYKWSHDIPAKKTSEESMEATMNMRNAGYDGVFAENKYVNPEHENFYEVVAFHPHQIKSALGNTGEFKHSNNINENMQTSNEFPEEAIVGHLKSMRDSGRYKIEHNGFNDRYNYHEFTVTSKPPLNAVHFHLQKGRNSPSWFNPDMAEVHTPYPEDPYTRTYARLKTNVGFTPEINEQRTPGVLYRGMSEEEFKNIKSTGVIKSRGDYNLEGQEGLTYYSRDPGQAAHYAHGFAPAQFKASGRHNVYVVAVKDPNTEVKVAGTGEDEVGIPHAISAEDILHVHVGKAYASYPGSHSINKDSWNKEPHEGKYSEGSSSAPSTMIGWKKKNFEEL